MNDEQVRLREGDVLHMMLADLMKQALNLRPYDADERQAFVEAVRQLLEAVPDVHQRMAWSIQLSTAVTLGMSLHGMPGEFDVRQLFERET